MRVTKEQREDKKEEQDNNKSPFLYRIQLFPDIQNQIFKLVFANILFSATPTFPCV